jgi:serine/threonine-protein kinase
MNEDIFGLVGTTVDGKYRCDALVGEGGFGVVYRGWHLGFEVPVAIKCLKMPMHFTPDAQRLFFEKFREEGRMLAKLSEHGSVVRVYDFAVTICPVGARVPYLVLEWLQGMELEKALVDRRSRGLPPMTEVEAIRLLRPAVDAIGFAHGLGIAHRDLKPANLFFSETQRGTTLKVLDFGIAKAMQEGETATQLATRTASGFTAFSPQYGAPEQYRSKKFGPTGPWTDVHALGLILSEMVTGRPVIEGEEQADWYEASTSEVRPTPRARGAQVSEGFERLCARALARMPADRFRNAAQMLEAMDALLQPAARAPAAATPAPAQAEVPAWQATVAAGPSAPFLHPPAGPGAAFGTPAPGYAALTPAGASANLPSPGWGPAQAATPPPAQAAAGTPYGATPYTALASPQALHAHAQAPPQLTPNPDVARFMAMQQRTPEPIYMAAPPPPRARRSNALPIVGIVVAAGGLGLVLLLVLVAWGVHSMSESSTDERLVLPGAPPTSPAPTGTPLDPETPSTDAPTRTQIEDAARTFYATSGEFRGQYVIATVQRTRVVRLADAVFEAHVQYRFQCIRASGQCCCGDAGTDQRTFRLEKYPEGWRATAMGAHNSASFGQ